MDTQVIFGACAPVASLLLTAEAAIS